MLCVAQKELRPAMLAVMNALGDSGKISRETLEGNHITLYASEHPLCVRGHVGMRLDFLEVFVNGDAQKLFVSGYTSLDLEQGLLLENGQPVGRTLSSLICNAGLLTKLELLCGIICAMLQGWVAAEKHGFDQTDVVGFLLEKAFPEDSAFRRRGAIYEDRGEQSLFMRSAASGKSMWRNFNPKNGLLLDADSRDVPYVDGINELLKGPTAGWRTQCCIVLATLWGASLYQPPVEESSAE